MTDPAFVVDAVGRRRDFALGTLRRLLAASRTGEDATQALVSTQLRDLGWHVREIARSASDIETTREFAHRDEIDPTRRTTVVADYPGNGPDDRPALLLWAHPDGMPFDGAPGWRHDPFAGVVEDGRIYGWSIADDLSGVAAMIAVAAVLRDLPEPGPRVVLASTPSKGHASGVLAALAGLENVGAGIYLHPAESGNGLGDIKAVAPGMLRFRLTVVGQRPETNEPNHTLYTGDGVDPIEPIYRLIAALREYADERRAAFGQGPPATMMVGTLQCGDSISRMPLACEAVITFSMPPGADLFQTQQEISDVVAEEAGRHAWLSRQPPRIDWLFGTTGVGIAQSHPLYVAVSDAVEAVTGAVPRYYAGHIASEIRQPMLNHEIPCVGIGPRSGSLAQAGSQTDEWLDLDDYLRMISVCALAAIHWASNAP